MWKAIASNFLTVMIVVLIGAAAAVGWGRAQYTGDGPLATAICLKVPSGGTMNGVADDLVEREAISNARVFRIGADYSGKKSQLKAGSFLVPEAASMEQIIDIVTRGGASTCGSEIVYRIGVNAQSVLVRELDPNLGEFSEIAKFVPGEDVPAAYTDARGEADMRYRIVIAEGVTSWQVVNGLSSVDFLEGDVAATPPEGSLAPRDYEVVAGASRGDLIAQMQAAQERILADAWDARDPDVPLKSPEEAMVLASIVEKETGVAAERRQVASVFTNRLRQGMKLQTDPTVIYGLTKGEGVLGRGLRQSELRRETEWNTYVIPALPPTPIANPGAASIEAALNPDETPYIFFVADGTGGHAFAETLAEHNENVAVWRKIEAERANN